MVRRSVPVIQGSSYELYECHARSRMTYVRRRSVRDAHTKKSMGGYQRIRGAGTTAYPWREDHGVSVARGPQRNRGAGTTAVIYIYIYIYMFISICLYMFKP
jgi:hypothetical protein